METPPLTRGRRHDRSRRSDRRGNTPAYAGKTSRKTSYLTFSKKHPRLRGEDCQTKFLPRSKTETPPLTRGRLGTLKRRLASDGNTPAYAGKTAWRLLQWERRGKHPRLRGEDRPKAFAVCVSRGNTPAYAGKTLQALKPEGVTQKHPRLRGEDPGKRIPVRVLRETPPLTRGRLCNMSSTKHSQGNTPAYAGKT